MSNQDVLPRVLTNPKLHRRGTVDSGHLRSNHSIQDGLKIRCPPIEVAKDKYAHEPITDSSHACLSLTNLHDMSTLESNSPSSPINSLSPACTAMTNACSHDHDYLSNDVILIRRESGLTSRSSSPSKMDKLDDAANRVKPELKTVRIPVPPSKILQPTSPREAKQTRDIGVRIRRRGVKPTEETSKGRKGRAAKTPENEENIDNSCIFVSTRKTAEPRRSKPRIGRKSKSGRNTQPFNLKACDSCANAQSKPNIADELDDVSTRTSSTTESVPSGEFDVTKDKLTTEWQKLVKKFRHKKNDAEGDSDDSCIEDVGWPQRQSTPVRNDRVTINGLPSPRPSVTPCPPNISKKAERSTKVSCIAANYVTINEEDLRDLPVTEHDSAYFSINSSLSSIRPSSSTGNPIFQNDAVLSGSRPPTGSRSVASTRPPSGGKRVAASSLSSTSSSSSSSDDDSVNNSLNSLKLDRSDMVLADKTENRRQRASSAESSSKSSNHADHEAIKARKGKKFVRQIDPNSVQHNIRPVPPRKPKKEPLPMHLRALPTSFFQEPNRVCPSPYNILPPVQPLFRQATAEDVADIRPVTPESRPKEIGHSSFSEGQRVIITGDTDMLQRLFEAVEPQHEATGRRVKRGRPKRAPRIMPSPKLTLDDNPCIMQSITDSLFPNLSIDKRHNKQANVRNQALAVALEKNREEMNQNSNNNNRNDEDNYNKELSQFEFISLTADLYDDNSTDVPMDITPPAMSQRQEVLALPQLPATQDYSQMLTKVAACL